MKFGGSIRLNPCGLFMLACLTLFILYYAFGGSDGRAASSSEKVSLKALLAASIDVAKKGGYEVKSIREQVSIIIKQCSFKSIENSVLFKGGYW